MKFNWCTSLLNKITFFFFFTLDKINDADTLTSVSFACYLRLFYVCHEMIYNIQKDLYVFLEY